MYFKAKWKWQLVFKTGDRNKCFPNAFYFVEKVIALRTSNWNRKILNNHNTILAFHAELFHKTEFLRCNIMEIISNKSNSFIFSFLFVGFCFKLYSFLFLSHSSATILVHMSPLKATTPAPIRMAVSIPHSP